MENYTYHSNKSRAVQSRQLVMTSVLYGEIQISIDFTEFEQFLAGVMVNATYSNYQTFHQRYM